MSWEDDLGVAGDHRPDDPLGNAEVSQSEENGELPADVSAVWGHDQQALAHAKMWIEAWGLEAFRGSKVHRMALMEQERSKELSAVRQTWMKKEKKKEKP